MEEVLTSGRNAEVRGPGLKALFTMTDDPKNIEGFLKVIAADPGVQGVEATTLAAEALGEAKSRSDPTSGEIAFAGVADPS